MNRRSFLFALGGTAVAVGASRRTRAATFVDASLAVDFEHPGRVIAEDFIGLSYESAVLASPDYFSPENPSVTGLLRGLGSGHVLRLGGNTSETTVWRAAGDKPNRESTVITPAAIDALAALLEAIDWRLIYGLNLARGTPEAAAEEALYVARAVGPRLVAFQIGNEPDGFGIWSGERPSTYNVGAFLKEWGQFHAAIRARVPNATFAGPAIAGEAGWIRPFIESAPDGLVLVTRHYYADGPARAPHISTDRLLRSAERARPVLEEMRTISQTYGLPYRIGEANSVFMEGHPGVSDAFGSALWGLEFMFQTAGAGAAGLNLHTGDAKAYTPIGPGEERRHVARPLYYGILTFKEATRGTLLLPARLTAPDLNMAAYATRAGDGELRVCLINKDSEKAARVAIDAGRPLENASILRLTAPSVDAKDGVSLGGSVVDDFGRWAPKLREELPWQSGAFVEVPAASAALVNFAGH
jgi:hypothetical protein